MSLITRYGSELYNQFAAPMMENLREVMQEETRVFSMSWLATDYPIERMTMRCGELGHHIGLLPVAPC